MIDLKEEITKIASDCLENDSFFIVDVVMKGNAGKTKFLILLDADGGVNIDDCASLSRRIANRIEEEDLIEMAYVLEVSSPGLDHPIALERQYKKNVGRNLKLITNDGEVLQGELIEISNSILTINKEIREKKKVSHEPMTIPLEKIEKANVLVSFK